MSLKRIEQLLIKLSEFGSSGEGINRLAYSDEERKTMNYIMGLCKAEGLEVEIDAVGNLIARREGKNPELPAVAFGSHIDTVYEGGKYDGTVGVLAALEIVFRLNEKKIQTEHPLEIIVFTCEESARFSFSTLGSKAIAGTLKKEEILNLRDKNGLFLRDEFTKNELNIDTIENAVRSEKDYKVFFELHIEQGPVLEREGRQIGVVTGIAAPTRFKLQLVGLASHSGTTPMDYRKDAFLGAAEIALALESYAILEAANGTVATVGVCELLPGAMNTVPGRVEMKIDLRGTSIYSKDKVIDELKEKIAEVQKRRNLQITTTQISDEEPLRINQSIVKSLQETCEQKNVNYKLMPSGAGHDAMNMAKLCPVGMLFIPSENGLSHNPEEYSTLQEIATGIDLLEIEILKWANG
ncbi:M20 family metallo-hydrolase [Sporosarcina sp. CAU 1771]